MVLVEVFTHSGERIDREIFRQELIKFGRHSSNDLILPDLRTPLFGGAVHSRTEILTQKEILTGPYRILFTNLTWLDQQPDLTHSQNLASAPKSFKNLKTWPWASSKSLRLWVIFNAIYLSYFTFMTSQKHDWVGVLVEFFGLNGILLIPSVGLSILCKAINREYRFLALLKIHIGAAFAWSFFNLDFFGLRWAFGDLLTSKVIPDAIHILAGAFVLYLISEVIFDHIRKPIRLSLFGIGALIAFFGLFHKYLPLRDQFQFVAHDDFPLVYPPFEKNEISTEELDRLIKLQMSHQTANGNELKKKLNEGSESK
jgi:hypothetical protein